MVIKMVLRVHNCDSQHKSSEIYSWIAYIITVLDSFEKIKQSPVKLPVLYWFFCESSQLFHVFQITKIGNSLLLNLFPPENWTLHYFIQTIMSPLVMFAKLEMRAEGETEICDPEIFLKLKPRILQKCKKQHNTGKY